MKKVQLEIVGLSYSQSQSGAYALILGVKGGSKRLPIIIGGFEAQAIAIHLENMKPPRPMTHDLFKNFATHYGIQVQEVIINKFEEGIFFSKLVCELNGKISEIDSRTSDAVALAIRFGCPIYTYEHIIDAAGISQEDVADSGMEEPEEKVSPSKRQGYEDYSKEELEEMLQNAVAEENFEEASRIRDEINKRKQKSG
jgi:bifunctional DNase/RNase